MNENHHFPGPEWIRANRYEEITGMTIDSIKHWRREGQLAEGVHWKIGSDRRLWINWRAMEKWNIDGAAA